jgi:hypothetical protein
MDQNKFWNLLNRFEGYVAQAENNRDSKDP